MGKIIKNLQLVEFHLEKELNDKEYIIDWILKDDTGELFILTSVQDKFEERREEFNELEEHIKLIDRGIDVCYLLRDKNKKGFFRNYMIEDTKTLEFSVEDINIEIERTNEKPYDITIKFELYGDEFKYSFKLDDKFKEVDMVERVLKILQHKSIREISDLEKEILRTNIMDALRKNDYMNNLEFKKECIDGNEVLTVYCHGPWRSINLDAFSEYDLIQYIIKNLDTRCECICGTKLTDVEKEMIMDKVMEELKEEV